MTSGERVLNVLMRLLHGERLTTSGMMAQYGYQSKKTGERDTAAVKVLLKDEAQYTFHSKIIGLEEKSYWVTTQSLPFEEILALLKLMMGTRALNRVEMNQIKQHLLTMLSVADQQRMNNLILAGVNGYLPATTKEPLLSKIRLLTDYIQNQTTINFAYQGDSVDDPVMVTGVPMNLTFEDTDFYVLVQSVGQKQVLRYRLNRFENISVS
ncbi:WYL domain-containing protein [Levilactobacillus tujiorum]|uniref:WYL domain-containing protein n=1 Tax=Levilactobacillus tujiorum TaxID=2912243 RepID=UPI0014577EE4|nr:hypothetical protein [Levilactobacillus tujiorum]NLR32132.1 hypothetical protein [Levilactobacillus tujiorum]